ncbi:MAG: heme-binding domain-containing protein [Bacteroidota bacterium]|nr:heme-binding domain-containing protein [Bacteroidota bacterium]
MRIFKKILLGLLLVFVVVQFIRPARNVSGQVLPTDIEKTVNVPDKVLAVCKNACYDCHSNTTRYPWYVSLQPMAWIMAGHIKNGKQNLNFSDFGSYSNRKQANKLRAIANSIKDGSMPLSSYTMMHSDAKLSKEDKALISDWAIKTRDSLLSKN